ncbi:CLUMA_CG011582, isoform A [Clunio marinus]|uniref:CLUMA_CG011582, isoform A n=1 Tax=Clunio marinus TaxID=568069 RepID=A0A1J1IDC5_9DIPT|nr:CLUMA_CG011582, isoform A [Clunio marinus]
MKLILFVAIVMFKCSKLSTAPTTEANANKSNSENEYPLNQLAYVPNHQPGLAYVSDTDDLGTSGVVFQFRRSIKSDNTQIEARRRSALDKGFMRFGRGGGNVIRFGRSLEDPTLDYSEEPPRVRKSDKNIMRFGRAGFMRFGRNNYEDIEDPEEYNDASEVEDFMQRPVIRKSDNRYADHGSKVLRLDRNSESSRDESFETPIDLQQSGEKSEERSNNNKKSTDKNILRFGRGNMMRFGRANMMRFGKRANMMRFGRGGQFQPKLMNIPKGYLQLRSTRAGSDRNLLRLGRSGNIMRFGRNDKNVMRFGKRSDPQTMTSSTKFYCEDDDCVVQQNANDFVDNENVRNDQLQELFGDEASKQGYGEYVIEK